MSGDGIWGPRYLWTTAGALALIFLAAVSALAVTTVMPLVAADLDGAALYAVAFSGSVATGIVGMVVAGAWSDRTGPRGPLVTSVVLFAVGLVVAAVAPTMGVLVIGRLVQGLGSGGQIVALYVMVARVYPPALHGRVFAAFSAAWVVPSLIGPFLAGAVAQFLHWRWVFAGIAVLTVLALIVLWPRLAALPVATGDTLRTPMAGRFGCALLVAGGCLALSLAGETGPWAIAIVAASVVLIAVAVRPLVPRGTLSGRRGLPSVVLMRGLIAGAFFSAEVYVPYLLVDRDGFTATWAGLGLTGAALTWAAGSALQGRVGDRWGSTRIGLVGVGCLAVAIGGACATAWLRLPAAVLIASWTLAGGGMGLVYPRLTVLTLRASTTADQGFNSAALSIFDSTGAAATIAVAGLVFVAAGAVGFTAVFALATAVAIVALVPATRLDAVTTRDTVGLAQG